MSPPVSFTLEATDGAARMGLLRTQHSVIQTPMFMPVGTNGAVKSLSPGDLQEMGAQIILSNAYHLFLRPGIERMKALGGLHKFMSWNRSILTDSGGFQVMSLSGMRKVTDEGVTFQSHIDGAKHFFSPEVSMEIQSALGSDIVMAFDECLPHPATREQVEVSLIRTTDWERRSRASALQSHQGLFGILQGGMYPDLRAKHWEMIGDLEMEGWAIGGLSVGEPTPLLYELMEASAPLLPKHKVRYLMGVGTPEDLLAGISHGIDIFDCVMPTRNGRNGTLFTSTGKIHIKNAKFTADQNPLDSKCSCYTCRTFTRAYLRHQFLQGEILASRLFSLHNLTYYLDLMRGARVAIGRGEFKRFRAEVLAAYDNKLESEE
jgi:queuine tRNA-ribosyltransferase